MCALSNRICARAYTEDKPIATLHVISISFNILMEIFYCLVSLVFHCILACKYDVCEPHPFCYSWSCETHTSNNYKRGPTKIPLVKGTAHGNNKSFGTKIKVNTCTNFVLGHLKKKRKKMGEIGFFQFHLCHCSAGVFYHV